MKMVPQILLGWCLLVGVADAQKVLHGKVIKVTDGDTLIILVNQKPHKVRLLSIDAPERSQAYGKTSRIALGSFLKGKKVSVLVNGKDRYKRVLGTVFADDKNVNEWMLRNGWAWHYKKYCKSEFLSQLEVQAKSKKLGLWRDKDPAPPWVFRRK